MDAVITPQLVDVVDMISAVRSFSSGRRQRLTECTVEPWGLRMVCPPPESGHDDEPSDSEITWVLPRLGLRLTCQRPRSRHAQGGPSRLTAVRVRSDHRAWWTTDLLLGLEVHPGMNTRIAKVAEFSAAVSSGLLSAGDADLALGVVHRTFAAISQHHNLHTWLGSVGIPARWPSA